MGSSDDRRADLLERPEHGALHARALAAFRAQATRAPSCAGGVYPDDPEECRCAMEQWLRLPGADAAWTAGAPLSPTLSPRSAGGEGDGYDASPAFAEGEGDSSPASPSPTPRPRSAGERDRERGKTASPVLPPPRLVISPHIDYRRGAEGYAHAAAALAAADADVFVVFGTAHASPAHLFTLTRLDFATPLGPVATDRAVVDALARELGEDELFADELVHQEEHSVELQAVLLRHVVRRPFTMVPVLCSSISHLRDPAAATAPFLAALARATAGRRVCHVAGADLTHVGPMYGDERAPSAAELAAFAAADRRTMAEVARGDPDAFHRDAIRDDARRRLCGVAPIYAAMRASGLAARLLHYGQWSDGTDSVSYAAAAG